MEKYILIIPALILFRVIYKYVKYRKAEKRRLMLELFKSLKPGSKAIFKHEGSEYPGTIINYAPLGGYYVNIFYIEKVQHKVFSDFVGLG